MYSVLKLYSWNNRYYLHVAYLFGLEGSTDGAALSNASISMPLNWTGFSRKTSSTWNENTDRRNITIKIRQTVSLFLYSLNISKIITFPHRSTSDQSQGSDCHGGATSSLTASCGIGRGPGGENLAGLVVMLVEVPGNKVIIILFVLTLKTNG